MNSPAQRHASGLHRCRNGCLLSYTDAGNPDGWPILVQHGLIASVGDFHLFDPLIVAGLRVISVARPGYGDSSPWRMSTIGEWGKLTADLVEDLGISDFDVLGISSGAPYAYAVMNAVPEKTRTVFILSGVPALYNDEVASHWPFPLNRLAEMAELQRLCRELFFGRAPEGRDMSIDERDSMRNDCFGPALDLRLRALDWGFSLSELHRPVRMQHSRDDDNVPFVTAEMTSRLLPDCGFETRESGGHFSKELLDDFLVHTVLEQHTG